MDRCIVLLGFLGSGCAGLLGIEDLAGENDSVIDVAVRIDQLPAESIDVIGHRLDGSVSDHQLTDGDGLAAIAIPGGGAVSVLIEVSPSQLELRTWTDLEDGDQLEVNAIAGSPSIDARIVLSNQNAGGLASWRVSFKTFSATGNGGLGSPLAELTAIGRDNLGDDGTISAIARLRNGNVPQATATVTDVPMADSGPTELEFTRWATSAPIRELDVDADLGITGQIVVGEVRGGQFFLGEDYDLEPGGRFNEGVLVDRDFAELLAVGVVSASGKRLQTDYVAADTRAHDVELEGLDELVDAVALPRQPPEISWLVEPGDTDAVLAILELSDAAGRQLTWRVETDPRRGRVRLPALPGSLAIDVASVATGELRAVASTAHDSYRAIREGAIGFGGHMASEAPILEVTGRVRTQSLEL